MKALRFLVIAGLVALAGCGGCIPLLSAASPSVPGLVLIKDEPSKMPVGTMIYFKYGRQLGAIKQYKPNHQFPNGTVTTGILVQQGPNKEIWMVLEVVSNQFYTKK